MTLILTVHRGTRAIGGSVIELALDGERLLLDAGRPLDTPRDASALPASLDLSRPATVLFSHSHQDHWGCLGELPRDWPVMAGAKAAELIRLSAALFGQVIDRPMATWHSCSPAFTIGAFRITPVLTDHSAPDAYMLLIEAAGKRLLYSGDFRCHGRKGALVEAMIACPPPAIDVLVMEGTNLGTTKPVMTEAALEHAFVGLAQATSGHLFVNWSAQNVDRTVTLYRAARRSGRTLVVDLYGADVLQRMAPGTHLPCPGFPGLAVLVTPVGQRLYARHGRAAWVDAIARGGYATSRRRVAVGQPAIILTRDTMLRDFAHAGLGFDKHDAYVFSNWRGYLEEDDPKSGWAQALSAGVSVRHLHTSGHASPRDLARFAAAIRPRVLVPVHGLAWDHPGIALPPIRRLADGETMVVV